MAEDILIIEENAEERAHLQRKLEDNAYSSIAVASVSEGIELMKKVAANNERFKLICLGEQQRAPETERRIQALRQLRAISGYSQTRILGGSMDISYWYEWKNDPHFILTPKRDAEPAPTMVWDIAAVIQHYRGDELPTRTAA